MYSLNLGEYTNLSDHRPLILDIYTTDNLIKNTIKRTTKFVPNKTSLKIRS